MSVSNLSEDEAFVQAARAVSPRVDRHRLVTRSLQLADDRTMHLGFERTLEIFARQLDARRRVVMPHAADAKSERVQRFFPTLDLPQLFGCDFVVIRNPRREACRCRLI